MFKNLKRELDYIQVTRPVDKIKLSEIFWIEDENLHRNLASKTNFQCCFNHQIGLPVSKILPFKQFPIFGYEMDMIENIERYKDYALNKARGIGATEIVLRWILFKAVHNKIPNRKFIIINGIRQELAKEHIRRLYDLCSKIPQVLSGNSSQYEISINKSKILALPANPSSIRGYDNVDVIFADEAAHWDLLDDTMSWKQ